LSASRARSHAAGGRARAIVFTITTAVAAMWVVPTHAQSMMPRRDIVSPPSRTQTDPVGVSFLRQLGDDEEARQVATRCVTRARAIARATLRHQGAFAAAIVDARRGVGDAVANLGGFASPALAFEDRFGLLDLPCACDVLAAPFGPRARLSSPTTDRHTGVSFEVTTPTEAVAVAPGVVVFADGIPGLGSVIVVVHDGGYHTVYARLVALHVATGQPVAEQEPLGIGGVERMWGAREIYFEMRHDGIPIDPAPWFRTRARE